MSADLPVALPVLELPTDLPRPARPTRVAASRRRLLTSTPLRALTALADSCAVSLDSLLVGAFAALLHRYTSQASLVLGTRDGAVHAIAAPAMPFLVWIQQVHRSRRAPVEDVRALVTHSQQGDPDVPHAARRELELHTGERGGSLLATLVFDSDVFAPDSIDRMLEHWEHLLAAAVKSPHQALGMLELMGEHERNHLFRTKAVVTRHLPVTGGLAQLFEAQADRVPDRVAVIDEREQLDYRELEARSNRVANALIRAGVGPDTLVGLRVDRTANAFAAIYGILKAGAAYVPLDPTESRDRLSFIVTDARLQHLVIDEASVKGFDAKGAQAVWLDAVCRSGDATRPRVDVTPDHLAYVVYTSGSTGRPKGVLVPHRALLTRFVWCGPPIPYSGDEVDCHAIAFGFNAHQWGIFGPLGTGRRTVMVSEAARGNPKKLLEVLAAHGVTRLSVAPSMLRAVLDELQARPIDIPALTKFIVIGEGLPLELEQRFQHALPGRSLKNHYGLTEFHRSEVNCETYVLDAAMRPVPHGVPGDIYLAGDGLARGYLDRPDLTAASFIADPFSATGQRLFKSGDRGRWLSDPSRTVAGRVAISVPGGRWLELLARSDRQVKIRGARVEPGEIEAALATHPKIREVAVVVRPTKTGEAQLVAFFSAEGEAPARAELLAWLDGKLPRYMVPSVFAPLERMPLTSTGKLDCRSLPDLPEDKPSAATAWATSLEALVAQRWADALGLEYVGADTDFFDSGGNSLAAVQLLAELQDVLQVEVTLDVLYEAPTVAGLSTALRERHGERRDVLERRAQAALQSPPSEHP